MQGETKYVEVDDVWNWDGAYSKWPKVNILYAS